MPENAATAAVRRRSPESEETEQERERRVAELRRQVQDGTYQTDATRLAAAMIEKHRKL